MLSLYCRGAHSRLLVSKRRFASLPPFRPKYRTPSSFLTPAPFPDAHPSWCCLLRMFGTDSPLNPGGIVPIGPSQDDLGLQEPAERGSKDQGAVFWSKQEEECIPAVPAHFGHEG